MNVKKVDARGLSCPQPVLLTRQAIEQLTEGSIQVLVDTVTSQDNVTRMARKMGCTVEVETLENADIKLIVSKLHIPVKLGQ